jgi:hypothetical protein
MSVPAILFGIYFFIGLLLMVAAVAKPGREKRIKGFEAGGSGDEVDAGIMIFIALLWPLWLAGLAAKKEPAEHKDVSKDKKA